MKIARMTAKRKIELFETDLPLISSGQVLIKVEAIGVCGSDLHYYQEAKIAGRAVQMPFVLGHEVAGMIAKVGEDVQGLSIGDRVAVEAGLPCGCCQFCIQGKYNLCPKMRFLATPPIDGALAEYLAYDARWVHPLPIGMNAVQGALIEPLAVGIHASKISQIGLGQSAFIFGCGCIGLVTLLALKSIGVSEIYMADMIPARMKMAESLGAAAVFDASKDDVVQAIAQLTHGLGVDGVFEMTGSARATANTVDLVKSGGNIVLVGLGSQSIMPFDFEKLIWKEAQIRSCFRYRSIYPIAINALANASIDIEKIVSHTFAFEEVSKAFEYHVENKDEITKMIIAMQ